MSVPAHPATPPARVGIPAVAAGLLGAAVSTIGYRELSSALVDDGTFTPGRDFASGVVRADVLVWAGWAMLAAAIVIGLVAWRRGERPWVRGLLGSALLGAGLVWFVWSSLEMHLISSYDWSDEGGELLGDLLYHGGGLLVAAVGWILVLPGLAPAAEP